MVKSARAIFILFIAISMASNVIAFQTELSSYVILKDGTKEAGVINTDNLEEEGTIQFSSIGEESRIYRASDLRGFSIDGENFIDALIINYSIPNNKEIKESFFVERLIFGTIHLEKVYAAPFEYAITKDNWTSALQRFKEENSENEIYDKYKGTLYTSLRDCNEDLETSNVRFAEKGFIDIINKYNLCMESGYGFQAENRFKTRLFELEIYTGQNTSDIEFYTIQTRIYNEFEVPEPDYKSDYKTSKTNLFGAKVNAALFKENLFLGLGVITNSYSWVHNEVEKVVSAPTIKYSELIISGSLEGRYQVWKFKPSLSVNFNAHQFTKNITRNELLVYRRRINSDFGPGFTYPLKSKEISRRSSRYFTISLRPALFFELTNFIDVGASLTVFPKREEFISSDVEITTDEITTSFLLFHVRFKKTFLR